MECLMMGQRGRKKGANGEQSRCLLLDIAAEEFAQNGYHETKISNIVKKANVTQPTFYLYFKSKEAIFQEIVDNFRNDLSELIRQSHLDSGLERGTIEGAITQKITAIFSFFKENQCMVQIGFYESLEAKYMKQQMAAQIAENLIDEQQYGYFQTDINLHTTAECLIGIIERLTITKLFTGLSEPDDLANEVVRLLLYGLLADNKV